MRSPILPVTLSWICVIVATVLCMQSCRGAEICECTYYSDDLEGQLMADGEPYNPYDYTAATYLYPLGTELRVTYNGKSVLVLVRDRCDNLTDIDLSKVAFKAIAPLELGRIIVRIEDVEKE